MLTNHSDTRRNLDAGVWESEQPGVHSRQERLAAAVDSDIRRAGRAGTTSARTAQQQTRAATCCTPAPRKAGAESPEANKTHETHALRSLVDRTLSSNLPAFGRGNAPALVERFLSRTSTMHRSAGAQGTNTTSALSRGGLIGGTPPISTVMQQSVYGQSVPQLVDERSSDKPPVEESGMTEGNLDQRQHKRQRLTLKHIPVDALVPPVAAAATTAVAAAPGGAAALSAIQRGAASQALQEAGVQLGVLVSSSNASHSQRAQPRDGGAAIDMLGISRQSRVALDMLLLDVCKTLGCKSIPLLYIRPDAVARAHFLALPRDLPEASDFEQPISWALHPTFVLTSEVLELLDREELRALFGSLLAFALTPGGCGFDASSSESLLELSGPVLDAIGASIDPSASPESHFDRHSSRGSVRSASAPIRRGSSSPSRMHAAGPRLSTAHGMQTATLAAAATAAALQDLTPGLLNHIGIGREEREWKARGGWSGGGLEAMVRRAAPLLRMAADRGAMLAAQVPVPNYFSILHACQSHTVDELYCF